MAEEGEAYLERMEFRTGGLSREEELARYQAIHAGGFDVCALDDGLIAHVRGWRLDRLLVFEWQLASVSHERSRKHIRSGGFDHASIVIVCEGSTCVDTGRNIVELGAGEAVVLDAAKPMRMQMPKARLLVIDVSRDRFSALVGDATTPHGHVLQRENIELLIEFMSAVLPRLNMLTSRAARPVTVALTAVLGIALGEYASMERAKPDFMADNRLAYIRAVTAARLGNPNFDTADLIALSEMSRASLYRLLAPHGGVAGYIQNQRLERVRVALSSPLDRRSFAAIAEQNGFRDERQCARLFRRRFEIWPAEYRSLMASHSLEEEQLAARTWELELR